MNNPVNAAYDDTAKAIRVTGSSGGGSSDITSVIPGTGATNLGKAEDAIHSSGDVGVMELGVANEAQSTLASDGDYIARAADTKGNTIVVGNAASGATDAGSPVKVAGKYNSTLTTFTDGQRGDLQINSKGGLIIGGSTVASGTTDSGNPVKVAGVNNTTQPTLTDGQRGDAQLDTRANMKTTLVANNTATAITVSATNADGRSTSATASRFEVVSNNNLYNGTTYDRQVSVINATNSTGTGIAAAGLVAQFDDASQVTPTENQFVNVRVGASHQLLMDHISPYPYGATPITAASGNVANASAVATLAASATKTTYITGFTISSSGATVGSVVSVTVVGTVSTTLTYTYAAPAGVLTMGTPLVVPFPVAIPGSAVNTAVVVTLPALGGGNTNATVVAHGYQL